MPATPVCTIDATGLHVPVYADCLSYFQNVYMGLYGSDISIEADDQDGQFLAILALALNDANTEAESVYNSFSPSTAQGAGLSSVVKINGIARKVPTYSTNDILNIGVYGTEITGGLVSDSTNTWALPDFTIPAAGQILVTATCTSPGAIACPADTINTAAGDGTILNPTYGWQSATNPNDAAVGAPLETDAALRIRQSVSTMIPSTNILDGLVGALEALSGVSNVTPYVNNTDAPDANGIPGHCLALIITGGDDTQIATVIQNKKGPGVSTFGTSVVSLTNQFGITRQIAFFRPVSTPVAWYLTIKTLGGYTADVASAIQRALVAWTNALGEGATLRLNRANVPANLYGGTQANSYEILSLQVARSGQAAGSSDIIFAFNEEPFSESDYVTIAVVPS